MRIDWRSLTLGVALALPVYGFLGVLLALPALVILVIAAYVLLEVLVVPRYGRWLRIDHDRSR